MNLAPTVLPSPRLSPDLPRRARWAPIALAGFALAACGDDPTNTPEAECETFVDCPDPFSYECVEGVCVSTADTSADTETPDTETDTSADTSADTDTPDTEPADTDAGGGDTDAGGGDTDTGADTDTETGDTETGADPDTDAGDTDGGEIETCTPACTLDASRCNGDLLEVCDNELTECADWVMDTDCAALSLACDDSGLIPACVEPPPDWTPTTVNTPYIAFVSKPTGLEQVSIVSADGSMVHSIPTGDPLAYDPTWSPDGRHLAIRVIGDPYNKIRIIDVTTGSIETLEPNLYRISSLAWSPDGSAIAFEGKATDTSTSDIYVWDLDAGSMSRLTETARTEASPTWPHPDVLLYVVTTDNIAFNAYTHRLSTGAVTALTSAGTVVGRPALSWDLRWLSFVRRTGPVSGELVLIDRDTSTTSVVGTPEARGPAMSPDGTWFVFIDTAADDDPEIFLATTDLSWIQQVTNTAVGEASLSVGTVEAASLTIGVGD